YTASSAGGGPGGVYSGGGTYVQPYPGPGLRKQVTSRGNYPVWRKDGREIVYLDEFQGRNYIWSIPVAASGGEFRAGTPSPLFPARLPATTFGDLNFLALSRTKYTGSSPPRSLLTWTRGCTTFAVNFQALPSRLSSTTRIRRLSASTTSASSMSTSTRRPGRRSSSSSTTVRAISDRSTC